MSKDIDEPWDGQRIEDQKLRESKLTGPKSRGNWSFCDMDQSDWDEIFNKKQNNNKQRS